MVASLAGSTQEICPNKAGMGKKYEGHAKNRFVKGYDGFYVTDSHWKDVYSGLFIVSFYHVSQRGNQLYI